MSKGIAVGVDGSPASRVAIDWAARSAAMRNVPLLLCHVMPPASTRVRPPLPVSHAIDRWHEEQAREQLQAAEKQAAESADGALPIESQAVVGVPVPTLVELSKDIDMLVVGTRGLGAIRARLLGSVSLGLVQHARCPVAVVPDEDPLVDHPDQAPVLVGIDGSPTSEVATAIAFDEASRRGVKVVALHAWRDWGIGQWPDLDWDEMKAEGEETLSQRLAGWTERYPDVEVERVVVCDNPSQHLIERSDEAQLVVVGSRGRGGFIGMLLGSVASAVVQSSRVPVIVARPA
ncbi:universal stress protein [Mycolicibacterium thermoresistibile]